MVAQTGLNVTLYALTLPVLLHLFIVSENVMPSDVRYDHQSHRYLNDRAQRGRAFVLLYDEEEYPRTHNCAYLKKHPSPLQRKLNRTVQAVISIQRLCVYIT